MIEIRGLELGFGRDPPILTIPSLSLVIGELVGLIGPPSCGKSLLLKAIGGLVAPRAGTLLVDGVDLGQANEAALRIHRQRAGMVFQNNALFDSRTIFENVAFPLRRSPAPPAEEEIDARVRARLLEVGLPGTEALRPEALSGGMQKRAGIARATIHQPRLRLYDEPTAGLDPVTSARILELIGGLHHQAPGITVVVSNEMDTLLKVVPRVVMLHRGGVVFDGPTAEVAAHPLAGAFARGDPAFA